MNRNSFLLYKFIHPAYAIFLQKILLLQNIFWNSFSRIYHHLSSLQSKKRSIFFLLTYICTNSSYRKIPLNVSALICMLLQFIDRIILLYFTTFVIILQNTKNVMKNVFQIVYLPTLNLFIQPQQAYRYLLLSRILQKISHSYIHEIQIVS